MYMYSVAHLVKTVSSANETGFSELTCVAQVSEVFIWISASCHRHFITVQVLSYPLVFFTVDMANLRPMYQ